MTDEKLPEMDIKKTLIMLLAGEPGLDDPEKVTSVPFPFDRKLDHGKACFFDALPLTHRTFTMDAAPEGGVMMKHNVSPAALKTWEQIGDEFTKIVTTREQKFVNADDQISELLKGAVSDFQVESRATIEAAENKDKSS